LKIFLVESRFFAVWLCGVMKVHSFPQVLALWLIALTVPAVAQKFAQPRKELGTLTYQSVPGWGVLPEGLTLGPTHGGVAVDKKGNVYLSTDNAAGIFVFSSEGKFLRTMAPEFAGTLSLTLATENGTEFLYGAHFRRSRVFKMTLDGTAVLVIGFPKESGLYGARGEGFMPSSVAVAPDGSIFVADGFGKHVIHKFTPEGQYLKSFAGEGRGDGQLVACQGIAIEPRFEKTLLVACDTDNRRLQYFDLDGKFLQIAALEMDKPTAVSFYGPYMAVAQLQGRVSILDQRNKLVAIVGDNPDRHEWEKFSLPRAGWRENVCVAPHGIAFTKEGDLYVQEWSLVGRITKFRLSR
jgi:hypothetical protein